MPVRWSRAGRSFLRRMIDLLHSRPRSTQGQAAPVQLNRGFRIDLAWWQCFVQDWNGVSFLPTSTSCPVCTVASDASGWWGCGAWFACQWFQVPWDASTCVLPIAVKELLPILVDGAVWGHTWSGHRVQCLCDNQAVVACLRSRTSRHPQLMHLLRNLVYVEAHFEFHLSPQSIDTHANHLADDLSRNSAFSFLSKVPHASPSPTPVPPGLVDLLLDTQADWTSEQWHLWFKATLARDWPSRRGGPTHCHEAVSLLLCQVQYAHPILYVRVRAVRLCGLPGR